jgi:type IV secretory pathway VirB4 component
MILGKMGAGKSTLMKMLVEGTIARNMYFRGIDKTKEYIPLIKHYGGTVVSLDGSEGMINPLEVMATTVDENTGKVDELASFYQHICKVDILIQMINKGSFVNIEMQEFDSVLRGLYVDMGL